jgi:hypothetical protein
LYSEKQFYHFSKIQLRFHTNIKFLYYFQLFKTIGQNVDIIPNFHFPGAKEVLILGFWPFNGTTLKNIGPHVMADCKIPAPSNIWLLSGAIRYAVRDWLTACLEIA